MRTTESKTCVSCGRRIEWRKKWERDWEQVRYCSAGCRKRGVNAVDARLEATILELLASRGRSGSVEVAEVARTVAAEGDGRGDLLEPARRAARRLVASGRVQIVQDGRVIDPSTAKGSFSIRRVAA